MWKKRSEKEKEGKKERKKKKKKKGAGWGGVGLGEGRESLNSSASVCRYPRGTKRQTKSATRVLVGVGNLKHPGGGRDAGRAWSDA